MNAALTRLYEAIDYEAIDREGAAPALAVLRIALGPIVVLHLQDYLRDGLDGVVYSDRYYLPYASWYPEASPTLYLLLLGVVVVSATTMSLGLWTRASTAYTAGFVGYNLFLSRTHFSHNRAFLLILLVLVAVMPTGDRLSVDAWRRTRRGDPPAAPAPLWPLWLARFEVCVVYLASATSKAIDQDWFGGLVLQRRAIDNRALAIGKGAPGWAMDLLADGTVQWWFAKGAIATELVIGIGLSRRRSRLVAIWVAIPFHLAIQVFAAVQVFSWAALAALCLWVTPTERDRVLRVGPADDRFAAWVRRLDWFDRFEVIAGAGELRLEDRHALVRTGTYARLTVLSRLPLTFWFVAPALVWVRYRGGAARAGSVTPTRYGAECPQDATRRHAPPGDLP